MSSARTATPARSARFAACVTAALATLAGRAADTHAELAGLEAPSGIYLEDPAHTRFLWRIEHLGLSRYTARLNAVDIRLELDAGDVAASTVTVAIDPTSVDTGYVGEEDFDAKIATDPDILNASEHPTIAFRSTRIVQTGPNTLDVTGDLTLLGVTRPVTLQATLTGSTTSHPFTGKPALGFAVTGSVDRTDFGLDFLSGAGLGDVIEIEIHTELLAE